MIFRYTVSDGVDRSVDTDSKPFLQRLEWLKQNGAPANYSLLFGLNMTPKVANSNPTSEVSVTQTGTIIWSENGFTYGTDVYLTHISPSVALIELLKVFDKPVPQVAPQFQEVPDEVEVKDWEAKNSPLGPPLPGQPGRYQSRGTGKQLGERWVGPSGRIYQLRTSGQGPFAFLYWQEL
jgi:hypothetical protein